MVTIKFTCSKPISAPIMSRLIRLNDLYKLIGTFCDDKTAIKWFRLNQTTYQWLRYHKLQSSYILKYLYISMSNINSPIIQHLTIRRHEMKDLMTLWFAANNELTTYSEKVCKKEIEYELQCITNPFTANNLSEKLVLFNMMKTDTNQVLLNQMCENYIVSSKSSYYDGFLAKVVDILDARKPIISHLKSVTVTISSYDDDNSNTQRAIFPKHTSFFLYLLLKTDIPNIHCDFIDIPDTEIKDDTALDKLTSLTLPVFEYVKNYSMPNLSILKLNKCTYYYNGSALTTQLIHLNLKELEIQSTNYSIDSKSMQPNEFYEYLDENKQTIDSVNMFPVSLQKLSVQHVEPYHVIILDHIYSLPNLTLLSIPFNIDRHPVGNLADLKIYLTDKTFINVCSNSLKTLTITRNFSFTMYYWPEIYCANLIELNLRLSVVGSFEFDDLPQTLRKLTVANIRVGSSITVYTLPLLLEYLCVDAFHINFLSFETNLETLTLEYETLSIAKIPSKLRSLTLIHDCGLMMKEFNRYGYDVIDIVGQPYKLDGISHTSKMKFLDVFLESVDKFPSRLESIHMIDGNASMTIENYPGSNMQKYFKRSTKSGHVWKLLRNHAMEKNLEGLEAKISFDDDDD